MLQNLLKSFGCMGLLFCGLLTLSGEQDWEVETAPDGSVIKRKFNQGLLKALEEYDSEGRLITKEYEDCFYRMHILQYAADGEILTHLVIGN